MLILADFLGSIGWMGLAFAAGLILGPFIWSLIGKLGKK